MANNNSRSESYEKAGVDITAGYRAVFDSLHVPVLPSGF